MLMAENFDPYHKWLGIPPAEQPPNYYRLLGLALFESDPDVIDHATEQRIVHLRTFQIGKHSDESQQLLREVFTARVCLLNREKKAAYDAQLRAAGKHGGAGQAILDGWRRSIGPLAQRIREFQLPRRRLPRWGNTALGVLAAAVAMGILLALWPGDRPAAPLPQPPIPPEAIEVGSSDDGKPKPPEPKIEPPKIPDDTNVPPDEPKPEDPPRLARPEPPLPPRPRPVIPENWEELVPRLESRLAALTSANLPPDTFLELTYECFREADRAVLDSKLEIARSLAKLAIGAAAKSDMDPLRGRAALRFNELQNSSLEELQNKARERLGVPGPQAAKPAVSDERQDAAVDLLRLVLGQPKQDFPLGAIGGTIQQEFPYRPSGEYDVTLVFRRLVAVAGNASDIIISLPVHGKSYAFGIRSQTDRTTSLGFWRPAGSLDTFGSSLVSVTLPELLPDDRDVTLRLEVRFIHIQAFLDGRPVLALPSYRGIREGSDSKIKLTLWNCRCAFRELRVIEVTGRGSVERN